LQQVDERFKGRKGYEVGYELFSINGHMLGHGHSLVLQLANEADVQNARLDLPGSPDLARPG
jgi:hypothetical protein